jgi:hypothetical protein
MQRPDNPEVWAAFQGWILPDAAGATDVYWSSPKWAFGDYPPLGDQDGPIRRANTLAG